VRANALRSGQWPGVDSACLHCAAGTRGSRKNSIASLPQVVLAQGKMLENGDESHLPKRSEGVHALLLE